MAKRLTSINPLAYIGVEPLTPPNSVQALVNPEPSNFRGFNIGDMWVNTDTNQSWIFTSRYPKSGVWTEIASGAGAGASNFVTDSGTAVADASTINVVGGALIHTDGLTAHTVTVSLDNGTDGEIIIGSTAGSPAYGHLTSTGGTITITEGSNTLNIEADTTQFASSYPTDSGTAIPLGGVLEVLGDGITLTSGSGNVVVVGLSNGTNGQILIGGGSSAEWENITSIGNTITITNGPNSINLEAVGGGSNTFVTNAGTATASGGSINMLGANVIHTAGSGSTVTTTLTNGTNGQLLIGGGANPSWANLTSTGATVVITNGPNTINLEATGMGGGASTFVSDAGSATEAAGSITMAGGTLINTSAAGSTVTFNLNSGTDGQLIIGSSAGVPAYANLTSMDGSVVITNGHNSINLAATGSGGGAATFNTDSGAAIEVAGAITIAGGTNIATSGSGSTVTVRTINSPSFSGSVTAGTGVNITTGGLTVTAGGITSAGGLTSSGTTTLSALGNGILRSNGGGVISSTNGTNGQVLIGGGTNAQWRTITSGDGSITITGGSNSLDLSTTASGGGASKLTTFTTSGTWTKAAGTNYVTVLAWSGGGGGAGGCQGTLGTTNIRGGGGGGQGCFFHWTGPAQFFGATEPVVVGVGGAGGAGATIANSLGAAGGNGGLSSFGNITSAPLTAKPDNATVTGNGGTTFNPGPAGGTFENTSLGGQGGYIYNSNNCLETNTAQYTGIPTVVLPPGPFISSSPGALNYVMGGGTGSIGTNAGAGASIGGLTSTLFRYNPTFVTYLGTGGGGGGGASSIGMNAGGSGGGVASFGFSPATPVYIYNGAAGGTNVSPNGVAGMNQPTSGGLIIGGLGGGGGAGQSISPSNAPGTGGNGGFPSGGGGGGGGSSNGTSAAAGGNGGDGLVIVIEW